ncbi:MAG: PAS domain-containing protein [Spirochaetes bacterium]|nr:PAS domain-containing protein [Spirochaetota bacterium]
MKKEKLLSLILDSWNKAVVFVDTDHVIQYMNLPAKKQYAKWGDVIGKSIFDCHNENSRTIISNAFSQLKEGSDEVLFTDNEKHRVYMRAVRDENSNLIGYYERYETPLGK